MAGDWLAHGAGLGSFVIVLAFCFAKLEIQIEGPEGWAKNLPTWRIEKHPLLDVFFGGRPLTGYHAWAFSFMTLVFHLPHALAFAFSWRMEARIVACLMAFWIIEDLLWFAFNPAWGLRRFRRGEVPWHHHWLLWFPVDYWLFALVGSALFWWSFAA